MKYIAIFDLPEHYKMGCACGKMIDPRGKEVYEEKDFENVYAQIEPLSEKQEEVFNLFNSVERIIFDLGLGCAYDMPSFWAKGNQYKVIQTRYHKGYMQALSDVEKEIRNKFGFAERENVIPHFFNGKENNDG